MMTSAGSVAINRSRIRLCLFLSATLIGTGVFYPYLTTYRQRSDIEALMLSENLPAASRQVDRILAQSSMDAQACYYKAVLERRSGNVANYKKWREKAQAAGANQAALELQDRLLAVQQGEVDRQKEQELLAQAQAANSDTIAVETFEAIARGYLTTYRLKESWQCLEFWIQWRSQSVAARLMRAFLSLTSHTRTSGWNTGTSVICLN
jgi:alkylated DNA nucleotide flippase Atl1